MKSLVVLEAISTPESLQMEKFKPKQLILNQTPVKIDQVGDIFTSTGYEKKFVSLIFAVSSAFVFVSVNYLK